jgi:hypothetical protein
MGRPPKEKTQVTTDNSEISKNVLNGLLSGYVDDHFVNIVPKHKPFSTGSLLLDSLVKLKSGNVVRLLGKGAELGKTSESFVLATNFMNAVEKSKTIYIKAEGRLSEELMKRSACKFVFNADDWDYGTVFIFPCNIFETVAIVLEKMIKTMFEQGEHLCIILDSLDGLQLKNDSQKDIFGSDNVKVAGVPLMTKLLFKRFALPITYYDDLFIITSQYSAAIKLDPYSPDIPRQGEASGGSSIAHQADYVFSYSPRYNGDYILQKPEEKPDVIKNPILGVYATIEIKKSGTDVSGTKIKIPIKRGVIGCQIWKSKEVGDLLLAWNLAKKEKAWITMGEIIMKEAKEAGFELEEKINGLNQLYDYFENNPKICDWLYIKFRDINNSES